jgi:hypothetical protein
VRRLVGDWRAGARRHSRAILALVMLELWLRDFLPRAFAGVRTSPERALVAEGAA